MLFSHSLNKTITSIAFKLKVLRYGRLVRQCIWSELVRAKPIKTANNTNPLQSLSKRLSRTLNIHKQIAFKFDPETSTAFISQPVNLQELPDSGPWFDKIIDPLMFIERDHVKVSKYYLSPISPSIKLFFSANFLYPNVVSSAPNIQSLSPIISSLFHQAGLSVESSMDVFNRSFRKLFKWYRFGLKIFSACPNLRRIYVSCWYSPEKMGLIAAARVHGIQTIDVQHGKQGRLSMYVQWMDLYSGTRLSPDAGLVLVLGTTQFSTYTESEH